MNNTEHEDTQETPEITPELAVVMQELNLPAKSLGVGIKKGYEARVIDAALGAVPGNVIWAQKTQIDAMVDYMDREVLGAMADIKKICVDATLAEPKFFRAGLEFYSRRQKGEKWCEMGNPNALNNAKAHAKAAKLPWPIQMEGAQ